MGKIKDEILDYCERHGLSEPPEGVTLEEIIKENKEHQ